jgi:hypothetical protein
MLALHQQREVQTRRTAANAYDSHDFLDLPPPVKSRLSAHAARMTPFQIYFKPKID